MTDEQGFLAAIREAPEDDDTTHLIYADWLDDRGDAARAEFIRLECRLLRMWEFDPGRWELEQRREELFAAHKDEWMKVRARHAASLNFRRGLVHSAVMVIDELLSEDAEQVFQVHPVRNLYLSGSNIDLLMAMASAPQLAHVRSLDLFDCGITSVAFRYLIESPHLSNLRRLEISSTRIGTEGARALAAARHLERLETIELCQCDIKASGLESLVQSPHLAGLRDLKLGPDTLGNIGIEMLAASKHLTRLRRLYLTAVEMTSAGVRALTTSHLGELIALALSRNDLDSDGLARLARWSGLERVESLGLSQIRLVAAGLSALASSPHLTRLRWLDLSRNRLNPAAVAALAGSANFAGLTALDLLSAEIGEEGARALAASPHLSRLEKLDLTNNGIRHFGLKALLTSPVLGGLRDLRLGGIDLNLFHQLALGQAIMAGEDFELEHEHGIEGGTAVVGTISGGQDGAKALEVDELGELSQEVVVGGPTG